MRSPHKKILLITGLCFWLNFPISGQAQCSGISLSGFTIAAANFTTFPELENGQTVSQYITLAYSLPHQTNCSGWKLTFRASGSFTNGQNTVTVPYFSIQFNRATGEGPQPSSIPMPTSPIPLSTTETILVARSGAALKAPPAYYFTHTFDLIIQGGAHLFLPTGTYNTNLIFTLYDQSGNQLSTTSIPVCFQINYYGPGGSCMLLTNGGNSASFNFSAISDYRNGITIKKPDGLYVTAYSNYQIIVQTVDADFISPSTSYSFPVSVITLTANLSSSCVSDCNTGVSCRTLSLSRSGQVLINNTNTNYPCQQLYYDLIYSIQPNDKRIFFAPESSYSSTLMLIIVPL